MKPVILTGATGLIGNAILRELLAKEKQVVMASSTPGLKSLHPLLSILPYSLAESTLNEKLTKTMHECEGIIHCAAIRPTKRNPLAMAKLYGDNVSGTAILMAAAAELLVPSFIHLSGVNLFSADISVLDESLLPQPRDLYLLAKWAAEQTANLLHSASDTAYVNLRVSAPYGPRWRNKAVIPLFIEKAINDECIPLMGSGKREQVFTHVDDIAKAAILCMEKRVGGTFNIASNQPVSMHELATTIIEALPESQSEIIFTGKADPNEGQQRIVPLDKIKNQCNWQPEETLAMGIEKMVREIKSPSPPLYSNNQICVA